MSAGGDGGCHNAGSGGGSSGGAAGSGGTSGGVDALGGDGGASLAVGDGGEADMAVLAVLAELDVSLVQSMSNVTAAQAEVEQLVETTWA